MNVLAERKACPLLKPESRFVFTPELWMRLGAFLERVDRAGALGRDLFQSEEMDALAGVLRESRLTYYLLLTCTDPSLRSQLMEPGLDKALDEDERTQLRGHLAKCRRCREEIRAIRLAVELMHVIRSVDVSP